MVGGKGLYVKVRLKPEYKIDYEWLSQVYGGQCIVKRVTTTNFKRPPNEDL